MTSSGKALIDVDNLTVEFSIGARLSRSKRILRAVAEANLTIEVGQALALVGESGSGKSTLGRCVLGQQVPTAGTVRLHGQNVLDMDKLAFRKVVQAVFQNPLGSLNPAMTVEAILTEPLRRLAGMKNREQTRQRCEELLEQVQLPQTILERRPTSLSGGMAQRVSIARALAPKPSIIVLDEAVSALDVATQAQVVNLLSDLRDETGVSYLFIAHDLALVEHLCDQVAVMQTGRVVEYGPCEAVCHSPQHQYSKKLLSAVPIPDPTIRRIRSRERTHAQ